MKVIVVHADNHIGAVLAVNDGEEQGVLDQIVDANECAGRPFRIFSTAPDSLASTLAAIRQAGADAAAGWAT
jgi:hypothetical protein